MVTPVCTDLVSSLWRSRGEMGSGGWGCCNGGRGVSEDEDGEGDGVVTMEAAESEVVSLALLPELVS